VLNLGQVHTRILLRRRLGGGLSRLRPRRPRVPAVSAARRAVVSKAFWPLQ
jgi:hypothetical protein